MFNYHGNEAGGCYHLCKYVYFFNECLCFGFSYVCQFSIWASEFGPVLLEKFPFNVIYSWLEIEWSSLL